MKTTIYFVRHGEVHNPRRIRYGRLAGFGLSSKGKHDVQKTAGKLARFNIKAIFTSPLARARETAEIIGITLKIKPVGSELLNEVNFPQLDGIPLSRFHEVETNIYEDKKYVNHFDSREKILNRMNKFVNNIQAKYPGQSVVAVSHGDPIMILKASRENKTFNAFYKYKSYLKTGDYWRCDLETELTSQKNKSNFDNMPWRNRLRFFSMSAILAGIFLWFSYLVHKNTFQNFDFATTVKLQNHISRKFDLPFSTFSLLGSSEVTTLIIAAIFVWIFTKKRHIFMGIMMFFMIFIIEFLGKFVIYHPGPPYMFFRYSIQFFFPSTYVTTKFSYPSGHTARSVFLGIIFLFLLKRIHFHSEKKLLIQLTILFMLGAMIISRIYLGEHWSSDVVGGFFLGGALGNLALALW